MPYCGPCNSYFHTWLGLKEHWVQSPYHAYCQYCDEHFQDDDDLEDHYEYEHSYCKSCNRVFKNDFGLKEHYRQSPLHHYCVPCNRHFQNENNLRNHLQSSVHCPQTVPCRGARCTLTFVSVSAMLLHLEAGTCVSGVTRRIVDNTVREWDRNNLITDPRRMIAGPSSSFSNTLDTTTTYYATAAAWNGSRYECYLCHSGFTTLHGLNQHLASPRHQQGVYVCPQATCRASFKTLSGLCQHVESERCGVHRFREVRGAMDVIVGRVGLLGM